jgi:6-phosphogluconolactonase
MRITRRLFAASLIFFAPAVLLAGLSGKDKKAQAPTATYLVFAGSYTTRTNSHGINVFRFDASTGKMTQAHLAVASPDPSWVVVHPNGKFLYAANEAGKNSMVSAYAIDAANETLTLLNQLPALGEDPCYLSFDRTGKYLFVANYTSGNVVVFPILPDGKLGEHTANVQDQGTDGPNKERQDGPHAHWVESSPDDRFVYVSDLGLDRVFVEDFDGAGGTLDAASSSASAKKNGTRDPLPAMLPPGSGPRHVAFSANAKFLYALSELQSTVTVFANDAAHGSFHQIQQISALPPGFSGRNDAAEIALHPSGKFLYTSNRGEDSVAVFAVDQKKGTLTHVANVPTGGKEPRHFAIDPSGRFLLAENQVSDNIVEFAIDAKTGNLNPTGELLNIPSPVCITFLPATH